MGGGGGWVVLGGGGGWWEDTFLSNSSIFSIYWTFFSHFLSKSDVFDDFSQRKSFLDYVFELCCPIAGRNFYV